MKNNEKIQIEAELQLDNNEVFVKTNTGDDWLDFGLWLEVTGFMAYQAMRNKEWSKEKMAEYVRSYILKTLEDYKVKK